MEYRDGYGYTYSEQEIETAIAGSNVSFDEYLKARGLSKGRAKLFHTAAERKAQYEIRMNRPGLKKVPEGYGAEEVKIEHAGASGFLEAAEWRLVGKDFKGQEKRVKEYLNSAYDQYDNITFKEEDPTLDSIGIYIDGEHNETVNLSFGHDDLVENYNEIIRNINKAIGVTGKPNENQIELSNVIAPALEATMENMSLFTGLDNEFARQLNVRFEELNSNHKAVSTDIFKQAVKITNNHGVSRTFNMTKGKELIAKEIEEWILYAPEKTSEFVNAELEFETHVEDFITEENLQKLHEHGGATAWGMEGYAVYKKWEDVTSDSDKDRFVDMIFDGMGIDQGFAWFDKNNETREKFSILSESQMKILIKDALNKEVKHQRKTALFENGGEVIDILNERGGFYRGEGKHYEGNKRVTGSTYSSDSIAVNDWPEYLKHFKLDDASTYELLDERNLAEANLKLRESNLSEEDRLKYTEQGNIAIANLGDEYVEFIVDGKRRSVKAEGAEFFRQSNPSAIYNETNKEIIKARNEELLRLHKEKIKLNGGKPLTDFEILEGFYEQNVANLLGVEASLNETYKYTGAATKINENGVRVMTGLNEKDITLREAIKYWNDNQLTNRDKFIWVNGEKLSNEETNKFLERHYNRHQEALDNHSVAGDMYLLNKDIILSQDKNVDWEHYGAMVVNSIGGIVGASEVYQNTWGMTETDISDMTSPVMTEMGFELSPEQAMSLDRSIPEMIAEGAAGSVGILLEFAFFNKATASIRAAKLFGKGMRSMDDIIGGWKNKKYFNGRVIKTEAQMHKNAAVMGISPLNYMKKRGFAYVDDAGKTVYNSVNNTFGKAQALFAESMIEGLKFSSLPSSSGHRTDAFFTGFGFGFMGQALAPVFGQITPKSIEARFGGITKAPKLQRWLKSKSKILENVYNMALKGPTSFIAGVEVGEVVKSLGNEILGEHGALDDYIEENWGDYSDPTQRLISNYVIGSFFGLSHHIIPTKVEKGKGHLGTNFRFFNEWRSLDNMKEARDEAFDKNYETVDYVVAISPRGKRKKMSPEDFDKRQMQYSGWRIEEGHSAPGQLDLKWELKEQPGDSKATKQRKKDEFVRNEETRQMFENMFQRAQGKLDLLDPIKGQMILDQRVKSTKEWFKKEYGIDIKVAWGTNKTMGNKRGSYQREKDVRTGKEDPKKVVVTFNVEAISEGLMPHEIGHAALEAEFSNNARFKSHFLITMGNIAKKVKIGKIDGEDVTLYDKMVEKNGKWDVLNRTWENDRIAEHELFTFLAEELAKIENYGQLVESNTFGALKSLINGTIGKKMNVKYDLKIESEVVRFFGDYIEAVNKGANIFGEGKGSLKHLKNVISEERTTETGELRKGWEKRERRNRKT